MSPINEEVQQKLWKLGYDPEKCKPVLFNYFCTYLRSLYSPNTEWYGDLLLFSGKVALRSKGLVAGFEDEHMAITGGDASLYFSSLERMIVKEHLQIPEVQTNDHVYTLGPITTQGRTTFELRVEDARREKVVSVNFWIVGDFLHVPKRG